MGKMRKWRRLRIALTAVMVAVCAWAVMSVQAYADDDTVTISVSGNYGQTEARSMLDMINDFRSGKVVDGGQTTGPWALDSNGNVDTESYKNLQPLKYDYELEQIAMQRAMEIAVHMGTTHQRPDGSKYTTATFNGRTTEGENLAAGWGQDSWSLAGTAFTSLQETSCSYSSQGHRRNMLGAGYKSIGIAFVKITWQGKLIGNQGTVWPYKLEKCYWVQEFSTTDPTDAGAAETTADDGVLTKNISISKSSINASTLECDKNKVTVEYGKSADLPDLTAAMRSAAAFPQTFTMTMSTGESLTADNMTPVGIDGIWTVDDEDIAEISSGKIIPKKAGSTTLTATSALDSTKTVSVDLVVEPASIEGAEVTLDTTSYTYDGSEKEPSVQSVKTDDATLTSSDYDVSYANNKDAGTATVTVTGKGNYTGSASAVFTITPKSLSATDIDDISNVTYSGSEQKPEVTVRDGAVTLKEDTDYTLSCANNINAGIATAAITGKGNYTGEINKNFTIDPKSLTEDDVSLSEAERTYSGSNQKPDVTVKDGTKTLAAGTDYTLSLPEESVNAGEYNGSVAGTGNYTGTIGLSYKIVPKTLTKAMISAPSLTYNGEEQSADITVKDGSRTLTEDTDYTISGDRKGTETGTYSFEIEGIGNYTGSAESSFVIDPVSVKSAVIGLTIPEEGYTYDGTAKKPEIASVVIGDKTLTVDTDYTISYKNNTKAGTATVTITGKDHYKDTATKTFVIAQKNVSTCSISNIAAQTYSGSALKPAVTVKDGSATLNANTDYTLAYANNTNAGTATVTITGKGNYTGVVKKTFAINRLSIAKAAVTGIVNKVYTGSAQTQSLTIRLNSKAVTCTTAYTGNKNIGTAAVTITGTKNYTGTLKKTFKINPPKVTIKAPAALTKGFTAKYAAVKGGCSYQIGYRLKGASTWKTATSTALSKKITGLKAKKVYQIRVRAQKKVSGTWYYGAWSAVKNVTTK